MVLKSLVLRKWNFSIAEATTTTPLTQSRAFRSKAALNALEKACEEKIPNLVLYNYPSFSGAFAALFAHLYHSVLNLPCLILPFSSIEPLRVEDVKVDGLETCYLVDFVGPKGFAVELSKSVGRVIAFDHRNSTLSKIPAIGDCPENLAFHVNVNKSSAKAVFDYFSNKLAEAKSFNGDEVVSLVKSEDRDRLTTVLEYIEDGDLRRWSLPDIRAFNIGLVKERRKVNCVTNQYMFDQLLEIDSLDLITKGNSYMSSRQNSAKKLLNKPFKVRLGKGLYGECLGIRADENPDLSNEVGNELSVRSAAAGLRPIGAVIYMQRKNLKMCLRSTDTNTDTSEVAKAYGGGGTSSSSSFIIRMDEYNQWLSPS